MFEQRLTGISLLMHDLRWAASPRRTVILTLSRRVRRAAGWFVLGALAAAAAWLTYAHYYPDEVVAADARLEQHTEQYLVYSIGTVRHGFEARCLLTVYRDRQAFTVSC